MKIGDKIIVTWVHEGLNAKIVKIDDICTISKIYDYRELYDFQCCITSELGTIYMPFHKNNDLNDYVKYKFLNRQKKLERILK